MALFTLTQDGLDAVNASGTGGPKINITEFRVSDFDGVVPDLTQLTQLPGTLHPASNLPVTAYVVGGSNDVSWLLRMDQTIGNFDFNYVGIYHEKPDTTKVLFAVYQLPGKQPKTNASSGAANVITIEAQSTGIIGLDAANIEFTVYGNNIGKAVKVAGVEFINLRPDSAPTNFYLAGPDDLGNTIYLFEGENNLWSLGSHSSFIQGVVRNDANTPLRIYSDAIGNSISAIVPGRYIIQFTTGAHAGLLRELTGFGTDYVEWSASLATTPGVGDSFVIYMSNAFLSQGDVNATPSTIAKRDSAGRLKAQDPVSGLDVVNKQFLENSASSVLPTPDKLVLRDSNGRSQVEEPVADKDIANKKYVSQVVGSANPVVQELKKAALCFPKSVSLASKELYGLDLTGFSKWAGGVLGPDGKIYCIPYSSTDILIIDPIAGTASRSTMGATLTGFSKWEGGVLGPDGKIYGIPTNSTDILIIDPISGTASRSNMGADLTGTVKWTGGVLGPDGKIYGIPSASTDILIIDPIAGTATLSNMGADLTGGTKWLGGVLGPDGKIYGIPLSSTDILIIDPIAGTATRSNMGADLTGFSKWLGGVLGPDGKIYGIPNDSTDILIIDPIAGTATLSNMGATLTGSGKWVGGVAGPDGKIYGIPSASTDTLIIDPIAGTATRSAMGADLTGTFKWRGGVLGPDGVIYGMPSNSSNILKITSRVATSLSDAVILSPYLNKF